MAGLRPWSSAVATSSARLRLGLHGDLQSIVDLYAEIPHGNFKLRMSERQLNSPEILGPSVDPDSGYRRRFFRLVRRISSVRSSMEIEESYSKTPVVQADR